METWFIIIVTITLCLLIKAFFNLLLPSQSHSLPPGPPHIPIIGTFLFRRKTPFQLKLILHNLHAKYGPIITLTSASHPSIFISDPSLAHQALVQNGAIFSSRPKPLATVKFVSSNQHNINTAFYGPMWRLLRRNLASQMLHPNRIKSFNSIRRWVLDVLIHRLKSDSESGKSIRVIDYIHDAMFCLLASMCFGEGLDEKQFKDIENAQIRYLVNHRGFNMLNFWPSVTRLLFRKSWQKLFHIRKEQEEVLVPLIRSRMEASEERRRMSKSQDGNERNEDMVSYVDTLLDLELPEEKRKLDDSEMVALCSEFLNAGVATTATSFQWILANLVKHSHMQQRVVEEIREVMDGREDKKEVKEEDLNRLPYLKAVILEGLRLHPPVHMVLPHAVSEDFVLGGYLIPKNGVVNFMVAEMGRDPKVWEDPMEFKPERFLNCENNGGEAFDITGSKEIKMMPFGVGRRMCPGYNLAMLYVQKKKKKNLAMLHLEYFVANSIWNFEWKSLSSNGDIDLSEKEQSTVVMKYPLQVDLSRRLN